MTIEAATFISQLNPTLPTGADAKSEGDDQIRLVKSVLQAQFPAFSAAALASSNTQLDKVVTTISINAGAGAGSVVVDASGNVGVGTATPLSKLSLFQNANTSIATVSVDKSYGVAGDSTSTLRLNLNTGVGGGYLYGYAGEMCFGHNREFISGTGVVARNTYANALLSDSNGLSVATNTALTIGSAFTPIEQWRIDMAGNVLQKTPTTPPSLGVNGFMVMNLTSNTNLRISVRGLDGTTRVVNLTLT